MIAINVYSALILSLLTCSFALKIGIVSKIGSQSTIHLKEAYKTVISSILNISISDISVNIWRNEGMALQKESEICTRNNYTSTNESSSVLLNMEIDSGSFPSNNTVISLNRNSKALDIYGEHGTNLVDEMISYSICKVSSQLFEKKTVIIVHSKPFNGLSLKIATCLTEHNLKTVFEDFSHLNQIIKSERYFQTILLGNYHEIKTVLMMANISITIKQSKWIILNLNNASMINSLPNTRYTYQIIASFDIDNQFTFSQGHLLDPKSTGMDQNSLDNLLIFTRAWRIGLDRNIIRTNETICPLNSTSSLNSFIDRIWKVIQQELFLNMIHPENDLNASIIFKVNSSNSILYSDSSLSSDLAIPPNTTLKLCTLLLKPFIEKIDPAGPFTIENLRGSIANIIKHFMKTLKFKVILQSSPDLRYGSRGKNQTYFNGCIGEVQRGNMHMAPMMYSINRDRQEVIDFTFPMISDESTIIYRRPKPTKKWWNVFKSLSTVVWILVILAVLIVSIVSVVLCKYNPLSAWNLELPFAVKDEVQLSEHLWTTIGSFFMQGQDFYAYPISARFVLASWWIFSVIIMSVFSADLTAMLTMDFQDKLPTTLEEFVAHDGFVFYLPTGVSLTNTIRASEDPLVQKLYKKSRFVNKQCKYLIEEDSDENKACALSKSIAMLNLRENCSRYVILEHSFQSTFNAFPIQKNFKYKKAIDEKMEELVHRGAIAKWMNEDYDRLEKVSCDNSLEPAKSIDNESIIGIYVVCMSVYGFGILLLFYEIFMRKTGFKWHKKQKELT